jgi:hypothetical protein
MMKYTGVLLLPLMLMLYACKPAADVYTSPTGYNLQEGEKFTMPERLLEVSGLSFNQGRADTLYTIQDEEGRLFQQAWGVKKQRNLKFAKAGDYEDLTILNDMVYVLESSGRLFSFPLREKDLPQTELSTVWKGLMPKGEYEGIYGDPATSQLYVLCKVCKSDDHHPTATGYVLNVEAQQVRRASPTFSIDLLPLKGMGQELKKGLRASALSKHPQTGDWFILSAVNKLLLVTDASWNIKSVHRLKSAEFNQPEGISFDRDNNLYISNEGDEITAGNVLKFKYKSVN